jgi:hypothetical protein
MWIFGLVTGAAGWPYCRPWPVRAALSLKATLATKSFLPGRATEPHKIETHETSCYGLLALCLLAGVLAALAQTEQTDTATPRHP